MNAVLINSQSLEDAKNIFEIYDIPWPMDKSVSVTDQQTNLTHVKIYLKIICQKYIKLAGGEYVMSTELLEKKCKQGGRPPNITFKNIDIVF